MYAMLNVIVRVIMPQACPCICTVHYLACIRRYACIPQSAFGCHAICHVLGSVYTTECHQYITYVVSRAFMLFTLMQVRIMKDWDPSGKQGPKIPLPDVVTVHTPKEDEIMSDKPQIGKEKEKEGYQPYMEDAPASMPVS